MRKKVKHLNLTWYISHGRAEINEQNINHITEEKTVLSDLEKLARREKIYCMTQQFPSDSESSSQVATSNKANRL